MELTVPASTNPNIFLNEQPTVLETIPNSNFRTNQDLLLTPTPRLNAVSSSSTVVSHTRKIKPGFLRNPSTKVFLNEKKMIAYRWLPNNLLPKCANEWEKAHIPNLAASKRFSKLLKLKKEARSFQAVLISQRTPYLAETLPKLRRLATLSLTPSEYMNRAPYLNDRVIKDTAKGLRAVKGLQNLEVELHPVKFGMYGKGLIKFGDALARLWRLNYLQLDCQKGVKMTDNGIAHVVKSMRRLRVLKALSLQLSGAEIKLGSKGMKEFAMSFSRLNHLASLSLDLGKCKLTGEELTLLSQSISGLTLLKSLDLNCQACASDTECVQFFEDIALLEGLSKIKLKLSFPEPSMRVTNSFLNCLEECLPIMDQLREFTLDISECQQLTNNGVIILIQSLTSLKHINLIEISFNNCAQVTKYAYAALKDLNKNENFAISFGESSAISFKLENKRKSQKVI